MQNIIFENLKEDIHLIAVRLSYKKEKERERKKRKTKEELISSVITACSAVFIRLNAAPTMRRLFE